MKYITYILMCLLLISSAFAITYTVRFNIDDRTYTISGIDKDHALRYEQAAQMDPRRHNFSMNEDWPTTSYANTYIGHEYLTASRVPDFTNDYLSYFLTSTLSSKQTHYGSTGEYLSVEARIEALEAAVTVLSHALCTTDPSHSFCTIERFDDIMNNTPAWEQPTGAHDAYEKGEVITYQQKLYRSLIDANVWSPTAYPTGWEEIA